MALQENIQEENIKEDDKVVPEVLPEKRPPEVETAAKVEKKSKEFLETAGGVSPEILGKEPVKKAIVKDIVKQEQAKSVPSIKDFIDGKTFVLGNEEVDPDLIAKVKTGDQDSLVQLGGLIDEYADSIKGKPDIGGVRFDSTGLGKTVKITEDVEVQKELTKYGQAKLDLYNLIKGKGLKDENAINALVKFYSTGDFLEEARKRVKQAGGFVGQLPFWAYALTRYGTSAVIDGVSSFWDNNEEKGFLDYFKEQGSKISEDFNKYRSFVEDDLNLKGLTYGSYIDSRLKVKIKEELVKKHGKERAEEIFKNSYTVKDPLSDKRTEVRIVSDELGESLLDLGFKELPLSEKFLLFGLENFTITSTLAKKATKKGAEQLDKVGKARKNDPDTYKDWDDVQVIRHLEIQEQKNLIFKNLRRLTAYIGTKFKNRGPIGAAEFNHRHAIRVQSIDKQIDRLELERMTAPKVRRDIIDGELENLQSQRSRALFGSGKALFNMNNKFLFTTQKDELLITMAQTAGHEYIPQFFPGMSSGAGEMIGAFTMAFKMPQMILNSRVARSAGNVLNVFPGFGLPKFGYQLGKDLAGFSANVLEKLPVIPKGFLKDRRLENIENILKRKLNPAERESLAYMQKAILDLDPEDQEKIFTNIIEYQDLRDRLIKQFDGNPELQKEAQKTFNLSFAYISGLAPLIALRNRALGRINARNPDIKEAMTFQIEAENGRMAANTAFKRFEELLNKQGISIKDNENLQGFIQGFKIADNQLKDQLNQDRILYQSLLDKYVRNFGNYEQDMDVQELDQLAELEIRLNKGDVNNLVTRREAINKLSLKVIDGLTTKLKTIKKLRGTSAYRLKLGRITEEVYDTQIAKQYADGRIGYLKAEKYAEDNGIEYNIGSIVQNIISKGQALRPKVLAKFFSAEGKFFHGRSGKLARNAFNDMAKRSIRRDLGLEDNEVAELFAFHRSKESEATGDYLGENADFVDIMLHLSNKEGSTLEPFKGTPFELEEMRRHFVRVAESTGDKAVASQAQDFADSIDDLLRSDSTMYGLIQDARSTYKDRVFDTRRKGGVGEQFDSSRTGPEYETKAEDGFSFPYKEGMTPDNFHKGIGKGIQDIIDNKPKALDNLFNQTRAIERFWADNVNGQLAFDLTTEEGLKKHLLVKELIEANVYEHWGALKQTTLENIRLRAEGFGKLPTAKYNFARKDNIDEVSDQLKVKVWDGRQFKEIALFDPSDMFKVEQDITELIKLDNNIAKQYDNLVKEVNGTTGQLRDRMNFKLDEQRKFNQDLEQIANIKSADQFFDKYIANGTVGSVDGIKQQYITAKTSKDVEGAISVQEAEDQFNTYMKAIIAKGLLQRAKVQRSERISFQDVTSGTEKNATVMNDTAQFSNDMFDDSISSIMKEYLDEEHVNLLQDLSLFLEYSQGTSLAKRYVPEGVVRGVSPNELISRAFNLAREMVSPTYVAAELGVRVSMNHDIEVLELAITSKPIAIALNKILITNNPTDDDIKNLAVLLKSHIATGLAQNNVFAQEYVPQDPIEINKHLDMLNKNREKQTLEKIEEEDKADENV